MNVTTIGLDLAKSVFQVHGIGAHGKTLITGQLRRGKVLEFFANLPACLVGIEACPSAHHWGREISKLGHEVRLMPPGYVKPYVKRGKNDRADAERSARRYSGRPGVSSRSRARSSRPCWFSTAFARRWLASGFS